MNTWCQTLGIDPPKLEAVANHPEANTFALLLVALLERGAPMTLADVAARFEEAGIADRDAALLSLKRCKPGRPPVYRDGDLYQLDPHAEDLRFRTFSLGLRAPRFAPLPPKPADSAPLLGPDVPLTNDELDLAWKDANLSSWSPLRLAVSVLDANGGPLAAALVVAAIGGRTKWHPLREDAAAHWPRGSAVHALADGRWALTNEAGDGVRRAREEVRELVAAARRRAASRPDPAAIEQRRAEVEKGRTAHAAELARLSRALLVAFPKESPEAAALLDIDAHTITTYVREELTWLRARLDEYDVLGGVDTRRLLRALGFDPGDRRVVELGPPQKTRKLNRQGRTLKITAALLVQGTCGISKPFGEEAKLAEYLANGEQTKLRRRLEADVKSLHALYEYGRLHRSVRLRWGFLDEPLPAPWVHRDEPCLYDLMESALAKGEPLEVVVGNAPGWTDPWSRAQLVHVRKAEHSWGKYLVDENGHLIDKQDVQRARRPAPLG